MPVVRISKGTFDLKNLPQAEELLRRSEDALREAIEALPGLLHYYVGIDRVRGALTNVSVWETMAHAHQMDSLAAMLAQRPVLEASGVIFEAITNHEVLWATGPYSGSQ